MITSVVDNLNDVFFGQPTTMDTKERMQDYLANMYPEANWNVTFERGSDGGIHVRVTALFKTPEEETFYTLKWA